MYNILSDILSSTIVHGHDWLSEPGEEKTFAARSRKELWQFGIGFLPRHELHVQFSRGSSDRHATSPVSCPSVRLPLPLMARCRERTRPRRIRGDAVFLECCTSAEIDAAGTRGQLQVGDTMFRSPCPLLVEIIVERPTFICSFHLTSLNDY